MGDREMAALAEALEWADGKGRMRFSVFKGEGWISTNSEQAVRVLCEVWNNRYAIAEALKGQPHDH